MAKSKSMCTGCRDDYYNHNREGGCWSFASARVVERVQVGIWEPPPYSPDRKQECLSCFQPEGFVMLEPTDPRVREENTNECN